MKPDRNFVETLQNFEHLSILTMTSQPLETIPEEPTPARVTADPPKTKPAKNPGRVESGKRLAERNRLAREAN